MLGGSGPKTTADQRALMSDTLNLQARRLLPVLGAALKDDPAHAEGG